MSVIEFVKILGVAGPQGDRQAMEVPRMRTQQEIYDELFRIGQTFGYESEMPGVIREVLRQRTIALKWVLNVGLVSRVDPDTVVTLTLSEEKVELLGTLLR